MSALWVYLHMITDEKEPRFFVHAHAAFDRRCYYAARNPDGSEYLTHHVLYAEAYSLDEARISAHRMIAKYAAVISIDAQLCSSLEIIPAHMRIWER